MPKLTASAPTTTIIMIAVMAGGFAASAHAQEIIGYSESKITVNSERTHCDSRNFELSEVFVKDTSGNIVSSSASSSQLSVETSIASNCEIDNYPVLLLFAVEYADGPGMLVGYQNVTVSTGEAITVGFSWMPVDSGDHRLTTILHACLSCSGDFGIFERIDFPVTDPSVNYIDLTISGLKNTYNAGEHIIFSINAKGVSDTIACSGRSPAVAIRNNDNGEAINLTPIIFSRGLQCIDAIPFDKDWTFGEDVGDEILLDKAGSYIIVASLEDATVEKQFSIKPK